jgi:hypothetical protein
LDYGHIYRRLERGFRIKFDPKATENRFIKKLAVQIKAQGFWINVKPEK